MIKSRLTYQEKNKIIHKIIVFYDSTIKRVSKYSTKNNTGGKIRQAMGDLGENLCEKIWLEIANLYKDIEKPIKPIKGENDQKKCLNKKGHEFFAHVDKHCYIKKNFILAIESKSYLDSCYYFRASNDFRLLKEFHNSNIICIVISIENAIKEESKNFIEDEKFVDKCFILTDGKRSSAKPIWKKEYKKDLKKERVKEMIEYFDYIFCQTLTL